MNKVVYFMRHGECVANVEGVIAGSGDDSPLTELGRAQAIEAVKGVRGIDFDLVISSPMSRTLDTAKIILSELDISQSILQNPDFIERDVGEYTGRPKEEYFALESSGDEVGESSVEMQSRVMRGLYWLKQQDFTNALVVTHNGTVRMIRTVIEGLPAREFVNMQQLRNGEYFRVDLSEVSLP